MADKIVVMRAGKIEQIGSPDESTTGRPANMSPISSDPLPSTFSPEPWSSAMALLPSIRRPVA